MRNLITIVYDYNTFLFAKAIYRKEKNMERQLIVTTKEEECVVIRNDEKSILKYSKKIAGLFINVRD